MAAKPKPKPKSASGSKKKAPPKTIDQHLAALSPDKRSALERVRKIIQAGLLVVFFSPRPSALPIASLRSSPVSGTGMCVPEAIAEELVRRASSAD